MDFWNEDLRKAVHALLPEVEGKPCVIVGGYDGGVHICRRISGLHTDEDSFNGQYDWVDSPDSRPDELSEEMSISCDCVRLGTGWWQDTYFGWYKVYDPPLVARSLAGDHSWVPMFLASVPPLPKPPAPDLRGRTHRLQPPEGRPYLRTEEVVKRLRDGFAFCAAHPHQSPDEFGTKSAKLNAQNAPPADSGAAAAGRDCTFSVVVADEMETTNYLSFEVQPCEGILIGVRDEQHQFAVGPLVERCARLLDYDVFSL